MIYQTLGNTGLSVSSVGFGCAPLGSHYDELGESEALQTVHHAIDHGINFFDTSPFYGKTLSEIRLGRALKGRRDQVIVATKGGRFDMEGFDFSYDGIIKMCEASLQRLQTDYIDVYQLHDIEFGDKAVVVNEAIPALQALKQAGKVRFIGVTGYPLPLLCEMAETQEIDVTLSYCHHNLLNRRLDDLLLPVVRAKGMGLINASITSMGLLTDNGPQAWHPAPPKLKAVVKQVAGYCREKGVNIAHLAIQFAVQESQADVTLLGTRTLDELTGSLNIIDKPIDSTLLETVLDMIKPVANISWPSGNFDGADPN
ncbi:MAG: aldo/keto reductase [Chloroflexota bacterium]